jgi:hypothetical protein
MVNAEKGDLLYGSGHAVGRARVSTLLIFSYLRGTDMSYRFKQTKKLGAGNQGMHKQFSHRYSLVGLMTGGTGSLNQAGGLVQFWGVITWRE